MARQADSTATKSGRGRSRFALWHSLVVMALAVAALASARAAQARVVDVSIGAAHPSRPVAPRFIGLSFEAAALPTVARDATRGNLVALLRSLGRGVMRFGGSSLDLNTAFAQDRQSAPAWAATTITPADFDRLRTLLRRTGWRAILGVPLGHFDPQAAAEEAAAASRRLGRMLAAVEIGNEPDAFWFFGLRPFGWKYSEYRSQVNAYREAIAEAAPGVPLAGPDTAGAAWLPAYAEGERPAILTPHFYPLSACRQPSPTLDQLLSPESLRNQDRALQDFVSIARASRVPVRLGETNSVGCTGQTGVSDTYGAALWALRYMLAAERAGIAGVTFHTLPESCRGYSPICALTSGDFTAGELRAMPEWYALLLFHQLVGKGRLPTSVSGDRAGLTVAAFGTRSGKRLDVVVLNTALADTSRLSVRLHLHGRFRSGEVLRLLAPALNASFGTRFGGGRVTRRGDWRPMRHLPSVARTGPGLRVSLVGASAALVRLRR